MVDAPGPQGKYARPELERRFLYAEAPEGLERPVWITDRYLDGTRLRVRRVEHEDGTVERKLGQKIRPRRTDPAEVWLTNLYLDENEYGVLSALPGSDLSKTRHRWPGGGERVSVDIFHRALESLVLAEVEFTENEGFSALEPLPGAAADVTHDDRFSGGRLAVTDRPDLVRLLASLTGGA